MPTSLTTVSPTAHSWCLSSVRREEEGAERIFLLREAERIGWKKDRVKQVYLILET